MRLVFCVACGDDTAGHLEHHHLVPRALGGSDDEVNLITLCGACHGRTHGIRREVGLSRLVREGMARAKAKGVHCGRPPVLDDGQKEAIAERYVSGGGTIKQIAMDYGVSARTVWQALRCPRELTASATLS